MFREAYNNTVEPTRIKFTKDIDQQVKLQKSESENLNFTKEALIRDREKSVIERTRIAYRLNQTEFPFGKLPINLDEAIAVFPIAIAIGFLVCSSYLSNSYLSNSIQLRKELHKDYLNKNDKTDRITIDEKVALIAPLWIDPSNSPIYRCIKFIIFIIPLLAFIISTVLILNYIVLREQDQILTSLFSYGSLNSSLAYIGIYLICASLFVYGIISVLIKLKRYR